MVEFDKYLEPICDDCGEMMEVVKDYGFSGQALQCQICGYYDERIDLRAPTLSVS